MPNFILLQSKNKLNEAELAAMWSLSLVLKSESDFEKICTSYANIIDVATKKAEHKFCIALEVFALRTCHRKRTLVEFEELKSVALLYFAISQAR